MLEDLEKNNLINENVRYDEYLIKKEEKRKEERKKVLEEKERLKEAYKIEYEKTILHLKEKYGDYWEYQGILIPWEINSIVAIDKVNTVSWWYFNDDYTVMSTGLSTSLDPYSLEEYKLWYAIFKDNKWYWRT